MTRRAAADGGRRPRRAAGLPPDARSVLPVLDADAAWLLVAALSPRPKVRVADVDSAGRAVNCYSSELLLTAPVPVRPYALYLADRTGMFRLLGFDLDPHRGPVGEDLAELRMLLERAGLGRHLVCVSGPGGGRHVWVALAAPAPASLVDALARGLAARLPSLDIGPLTNPATGCLRPPGSPHRAGGRSQPAAGALADLTSPKAGRGQLLALLNLLDAPPAPRPVSEGRVVVCDGAGAPHLPGERTVLPAGSRAALHDPLPAAADTSAVLWSALVGAARARWHLGDLTPLLASAPGLEHARTARTGSLRTARGPACERRLLARQWARAVTFGGVRWSV